MADIKLNIGAEGADLKGLVENLQKAVKYAEQIKKMLGDVNVIKNAADLAKQINQLEKLRKTIEVHNLANEKRAVLEQRLANQQQAAVVNAKKLELATSKLELANKKNAAAQEAYNKKIERSKENMNTWEKALGSFAFKFNALGNIAGNIAGKLGSVVSNVISFKKIVGSADSSQDSWNRTLQQTNNVLAVFNKSLATGDFSGFIENLKKSIEYGAEFADIMDDIEDRTRELSVAEARQENVITQLRIAQKDATKTTEEQIAAGKQIIIEEEKLAALRTGIAKDALDAEAQNIANLTGLKKDEVLATVEQYSSMKDLIATGEAYNKRMLTEEAIRQMSINGIDNFTEAQQKQYDELIRKRDLVKNTDLELLLSAEKYYLGTKKLSEDEREVITKRLIDNYNAQNSANQRTLKIQTALNNDIASQNNESAKGELKNISDIGNAREALAKAEAEDAEETRKADEQWEEENMNRINAETEAKKEALKEHQEAVKENVAQITELTTDGLKSVVEEDKKTTEERITNAKMYLESTATALDVISSLFEASKQRELSAVGDNEKRREEIEAKYRKKQQAMSIAQAIINGALSVTNLIANVPGSVINPATWVGIAISAAATAAQVGIIATQKFAEGGEINGRPHSQGGTIIEAEKGEYVINKGSVSKYKDLIEAINDDDKNKIFNALNMELNGKQFKLPQAKNKIDYNKKLYELLAGQEVYGETNEYYVIQKGSTKMLIPKTK